MTIWRVVSCSSLEGYNVGGYVWGSRGGGSGGGDGVGLLIVVVVVGGCGSSVHGSDR